MENAKREGQRQEIPEVRGPPDFGNLLAVLSRSKPARPTLFEFFLNGRLYRKLTADTIPDPDRVTEEMLRMQAFRGAGYDYATVRLPGFGFAAGEVRTASTRSLNEGAVITDRASFDAYEWPDPRDARYDVLDALAAALPAGMKLIVCTPGGVLENVVKLVGFENLCFMTVDDETLVFDVFEAVGSRLVRFYEHCVSHEAVGAVIGNDDWGFKSQTMLPPEQLRRFVFPWHKQIVRTAHAAGKPAVLHSCGQLQAVMDDIIDDMGYDGKHSYEDAIQPVEEAYDQYHDRIAILGGIDVDFVCRSTPEAVHKRAEKMLARAERDGAYALGTGNSVPDYVPDEQYFSLISAALEQRAAV